MRPVRPGDVGKLTFSWTCTVVGHREPFGLNAGELLCIIAVQRGYTYRVIAASVRAGQTVEFCVAEEHIVTFIET